MAAHLNFINDGGRTYLTVDGQKVGYYRVHLFDGFEARMIDSYRSATFHTEQECQEWLKSLV